MYEFFEKILVGLAVGRRNAISRLAARWHPRRRPVARLGPLRRGRIRH